jgi:hypothetical protein
VTVESEIAWHVIAMALLPANAHISGSREGEQKSVAELKLGYMASEAQFAPREFVGLALAAEEHDAVQPRRQSRAAVECHGRQGTRKP